MSLTPLLALQFRALNTTLMPVTVLAHMRICTLLILALSYLKLLARILPNMLCAA